MRLGIIVIAFIGLLLLCNAIAFFHETADEPQPYDFRPWGTVWREKVDAEEKAAAERVTDREKSFAYWKAKYNLCDLPCGRPKHECTGSPDHCRIHDMVDVAERLECSEPNIVYAGLEDPTATISYEPSEPNDDTHICPVHGELNAIEILYIGKEGYKCCSDCVYLFLISILKDNIPRLTNEPFCDCNYPRGISTCTLYGCDGKDCTTCIECGKKVKIEKENQ